MKKKEILLFAATGQIGKNLIRKLTKNNYTVTAVGGTINVLNDAGTNVYDLIKYKNVLFTISSIKNIQHRLTNEKN